jgi:hypothetical protein
MRRPQADTRDATSDRIGFGVSRKVLGKGGLLLLPSGTLWDFSCTARSGSFGCLQACVVARQRVGRSRGGAWDNNGSNGDCHRASLCDTYHQTDWQPTPQGLVPTSSGRRSPSPSRHRWSIVRVRETLNMVNRYPCPVKAHRPSYSTSLLPHLSSLRRYLSGRRPHLHPLPSLCRGTCQLPIREGHLLSSSLSGQGGRILV